MGKSKSPAPAPVPQPVTTPVQQKPVEPIARTATNAEARDRASQNPGAELLSSSTTPEDEAAKRAQASMMG